ncbi:9033_t:CDS:1, partial [Diversispora eburnea]
MEEEEISSSSSGSRQTQTTQIPPNSPETVLSYYFGSNSNTFDSEEFGFDLYNTNISTNATETDNLLEGTPFDFQFF